MKPFRTLVVLSFVALSLVIAAPKAKAVDIDFDTYAAISFSKSTGKYGYAWNYRSKAAAERAALAKCPESDAKIVGWVKGGWLALAIGDNNAYGIAWEYGEGASNLDAKKTALKECRERTTGAKVVLCICSGDVDPEVIE